MILDNKYRYIKQLGFGGFGKVFLAEDIISKRKVAIKRLKFANKFTTYNFIKEIEIISKFEHPNVVKYYHHFIESDILYLVMEYCDGGTLQDKIDGRKYSTEQAINWVVLIAQSLRKVNKIGVFHRDVRPVNILFNKNGDIKLSDFGIANTVFGVRAYMSPNSSFNDNDPRVDIYSLGVILIELLTYKNPFFFKSKEEIQQIHKKNDFGIESLPIWLQKTIQKAVSIDIYKRFQFMIEFEEALKSQNTPVIFDNKFFLSSLAIQEGLNHLKKNKRDKAKTKIEYGLSIMENNIVGQKALGLLFLYNNDLVNAKKQIERALQINPRLNLHYELSWLNLEMKKYDKALSLISDYISRNPLEYDAYIILLKIYIETLRFEPALDLIKVLSTNINLSKLIIQNIILICKSNLEKKILSDFDTLDHPFMEFNLRLSNYLAKNKEFNIINYFLFIDYQFLNFENSKLFIRHKEEEYVASNYIVTFEIDNKNELLIDQCKFNFPDFFVIINFKDNIWIFPMRSSQLFIDGVYIQHKMLIQSNVEIKFGNHLFHVNIDEWKLF
jgi:serine/threonine protein kinase